MRWVCVCVCVCVAPLCPLLAFLLLLGCGPPASDEVQPVSDEAQREPPPPFDVAGFEAAMAGPDARARTAALDGLLSVSEPPATTIPTLASALADENRWVRDRAAQALARFGPAAAPALPALVRALRDPDCFVRWRAAKALASVGPAAEPAREELEVMAASADETELGRHWSARALEKIRGE